jgi:zinc transport system substrate-binding protein
MKFIKFFLPALIIASSASAQDKSPLIVASINPVYQIILAITQDKNHTVLIVKSAVSEHNSRLKKSDVDSLSSADLVFYIDDNLEKNFAKSVKNLNLKSKAYQVSAINGIKLLKKKNNPQKIDPHLWLNPKNAIIIAEFIAEKISAIDPKNAKKYKKNLQKFKKEIAATENKIKINFAMIKDKNYVFYHGGYQYFENYFGLKEAKVISYNENLDLSIKEARAFDSLAKSTKIKCLFGEVYDEKNSALKLAQNYKIKFMALDLVGTKDEGYDKILMNLADDMKACLR